MPKERNKKSNCIKEDKLGEKSRWSFLDYKQKLKVTEQMMLVKRNKQKTQKKCHQFKDC